MLLSSCFMVLQIIREFSFYFTWKIPVVHTGKQPSEDEAVLLLNEVERYTLASHLFWGLWGIISVSIQHLALSLFFTIACVSDFM
jgi:hypothetical protein